MTTNLYDRVAGHIVEAIEGGSLQPGQKVPSVRRLSLQRGVSISTVLQAYRVLGDGGWLESRPQSGYYVRRRFAPCTCLEPDASQPSGEPAPVNIGDLAADIVKAGSRPGLMRLGAAMPCEELLPMRALNQAVISTVRRYPHLGAN